MKTDWWLLVRMLAFIMTADEAIPWHTGYTYYGLNLKRQAQGWFMVVAAKRPKGERVVSFYAGRKPWDCFAALASDVAHGTVKWTEDRYKK